MIQRRSSEQQAFCRKRIKKNPSVLTTKYQLILWGCEVSIFYMPESIPESWRNDVIRILQQGNRRHIEWTTPARQRWDSDTFGAWEYEAYDSIIEALQTPTIQGNETTALPGQVAT